MDLSTTYMGIDLRTPLVASASPLSESVDNIKKLEDYGASAVVLYSLFEEQLELERQALDHHLSNNTHSHAEALTYFPQPYEFKTGPEGYLELIRKAKEAVDIPIIASLNGSSLSGWIGFARMMELAGADGLELNLYNIPTDLNLTGAQVEETYLEVVRTIKNQLNIPVAVKLSPYFSNMANFAKRLDEAKADALVLFNRFYQPDIDLETLEITPHVLLSTPQDLRLPMTWIGILYGKLHASLAATSGIHNADDAIKLIMAGADVTMMTSALLRRGIEHLRFVEQEMVKWLEENEYVSVQQMKGSLSQKNCPDPTAFERAQYMRALTGYKVKSPSARRLLLDKDTDEIYR
jgi:dihydroorotate dehydrogenase (fumarate)